MAGPPTLEDGHRDIRIAVRPERVHVLRGGFISPNFQLHRRRELTHRIDGRTFSSTNRVMPGAKGRSSNRADSASVASPLISSPHTVKVSSERLQLIVDRRRVRVMLGQHPPTINTAVVEGAPMMDRFRRHVGI